MKMAIGLLVVLAAVLFGIGHITSKSKNTDTASSAIVPQVGGVAAFAVAAVLTLGWGLYRLFTS